MAIHWTRVASFPQAFGGCGPQGITCLGSGRMVGTMEELDDSGGITRVVLSTDNGLTWTEQLPSIVSPLAVTNSVIRAFGPNKFFMGTLHFDQVPWEPDLAMVALGTLASGVVSFQSRVTASQYATLSPIPLGEWAFDDVIVVPGGNVYAIAHRLSADGDATQLGQYLVSTDGGVTFGSPATTGVLTPNISTSSERSGLWAGGNTILIMQENSTPTIVIARSTNLGSSWTPATVASYQGGLEHGAYMPGIQRVIVGGYASGSPPTARVFYSDNDGLTWAPSTLPSMASSISIAMDVVALNNALVVVGLSNNGPAGIFALLSTDGGVTFTDPGTYSPSIVNGSVTQLAVADDGAVLAMYGNNTTNNYEIWRGVVDGFSGPGPCGAFTSVGTASIVTTILASVDSPPPPPPPPPPGDGGTAVDFRIDVPSQWAQESGAMPITIYARVQGGAVNQGYTGTATISVSNPGAGSVSQLFGSGAGGSLVPLSGTVTSAFVAGVWVGYVILATSSLATTSLSLKATDGSLTGTSPQFLWTVGGEPPPPPPPSGGNDAFGFFKGNIRLDVAPAGAYAGYNPQVPGWNPTFGPVPFSIGAMVNDGQSYPDFNGTCRFFTSSQDVGWSHIAQLYDVSMNPIPSTGVPFSGGGFQGFALLAIDVAFDDARWINIGCENEGGSHQQGFVRAIYWGPPPGPSL